MQVKISHLENVKFAITSRHHTIICDQPASNNGTDEGMTPPELMLASLGSCAAYYAAEYLRTRDLAQTGVEVTVNAEKLLKPARLGNFDIHIVSPVTLSPEQEEAMMRSVKHCLIHNTLLSPPEIQIKIDAAVAAE